MTTPNTEDFEFAARATEEKILAAIGELERAYPFIQIDDMQLRRVKMGTFGSPDKSRLVAVDLHCKIVRQ